MSEITTPAVKFSEKITGSVIKGWQVGGYALALLVLAAATLVMACLLALSGHEQPAIAFLLLGSAVIVFVGYNFYVKAIVPAKMATERLEQNGALVDTVQELAILLTDIISQLNDYALLNTEAIVSTVEGVKERIARLPGGSLLVGSSYFAKGENLAKGVRQVAASSRGVVADVRDSITKADVSRIGRHLEDLKQLKQTIEKELLSAQGA
ncbi:MULTISPECIES: hypothetical protein [unclassified Bradyrhizobium]